MVQSNMYEQNTSWWQNCCDNGGK